MTVTSFEHVDKIYKVLNPVLLKGLTEDDEPKLEVLPRGSLLYVVEDRSYVDLYNHQGTRIGCMWGEDFKALFQYLKFEE